MLPLTVFLAQVGIDDHLAHYTGLLQPKRYMRYSETVWRSLLGNSVQYINRLTASQIVQLMGDAGLTLDDVETHDLNTISPDDVHPGLSLAID